MALCITWAIGSTVSALAPPNSGMIRSITLSAARSCAVSFIIFGASAFAHQNTQGRHFQSRHGHDGFGNGCSLTAFFRIDSAESTGCIDESDHRMSEFFGLLHQPDGFGVTFRFWHTEIPVEAFLHGFASEIGQNRDCLTTYQCQTADKRMVITEAAVAVEFTEILDNPFNIVHGSGTITAADHFYLFPCRFFVRTESIFLIYSFIFSGRGLFPPGRMDIEQIVQGVFQIVPFHNPVNHLHAPAGTALSGTLPEAPGRWSAE